MLFDGYDGDPERTAEALVDGWFLTSDAGRLDEDGRLPVLGRVDDMVVSGGVKVPAAGRRGPASPASSGGGRGGARRTRPRVGERVVAFVVGDLDLAEAREWVASEHPRPWAPRQLVLLDVIPLLANGKPDRLALTGLA